MSRFSHTTLLIVLACLALAASACGEERAPQAVKSAPAAESPPTATTAVAARSGKTIKTGKTDYGRILQDGRGRSVYLFTKESGSTPHCYGACAKAWPPVLTKGQPVAAGAARQSKLGTTKRRGGRSQVTYNGHPLYYYVQEDEPNEVLCQAAYEFGGYWYVVDAAGHAKK